MSVVDLFRTGAACVASVCAAASGFVVSQTAPEVVGVAAPRVPQIPDSLSVSMQVSGSDDLARWSEAFVNQEPTLVAALDVKPWRFIGVLGEGRNVKGIFASPESAGQTVFVTAGDRLPDGRRIAAVTGQYVLFAAEPTTGAVVGVGEVNSFGPTRIGLFSGDSGNDEARKAFEQRAQARSNILVQSNVDTDGDAGVVPPRSSEPETFH